MTCPNNNFTSNRPPNGNDDPCNSSGLGEFTTGSYWMYDPSAAGADTGLHGDCPRLFIRTGDTCAVSEWLEIKVTGLQTNAAAPTNADCCPAGTMWLRPDALSGIGYDEVYISYADLDADPIECNWCRICPANLEVLPVGVAAGQGQVTVGAPATITGGAWQELGNDATATITNPSLTHDMQVCIHLNGVSWGANNLTGDNDAIMHAGFGWELDGGGLNIFTNTTLTLETPLNFAQQIPPFGFSNCNFVLAPGDSLTFRVQPVIRMQNGTFQGNLTINSFDFNLTGTAILP